jgi:hypothetical protein
MLIVTGNVQVKPETRAAAMQAALTMVEATRNEAFGAMYHLTLDLARCEPPAEPVQAKVPQNEPATLKQTASREQDELEKKTDKIADASNSVQRNKENIATQQNELESSENTVPTRRSHGSALPE